MAWSGSRAMSPSLLPFRAVEVAFEKEVKVAQVHTLQ
jgi:hypothetical protein